MTCKLKMRAVKTLFFVLIVSWGGWAARVWAQAADEDHKPTIHGIATGMTAQDVLDHLGGRMPDGRKEEKGATILTWKIEDGNILLVTFRGENISELKLFYKKTRPTTDFWLVPLSKAGTSVKIGPEEGSAALAVGQISTVQSVGAGPPTSSNSNKAPGAPAGVRPETAGATESQSGVTASDPRLRRDYKATETEDKMRTVWTRREKAKNGYEVEISFLSTSRQQLGDRHEEYVEYKYVTVPKDEMKKFDNAVRSSPKK